jgi:hypothetical protein
MRCELSSFEKITFPKLSIFHLIEIIFPNLFTNLFTPFKYMTRVVCVCAQACARVRLLTTIYNFFIDFFLFYVSFYLSDKTLFFMKKWDNFFILFFFEDLISLNIKKNIFLTLNFHISLLVLWRHKFIVYS